MKSLLFIVAGLMAGSAMAATAGLTTDTLTISGTVVAINELAINPNLATKDSLKIISSETVSVATVDELSNNLNGYKIMMSSLNASKLVHGINPLYFANYTVKYDGGAEITLSGTPQQVKDSGPLTGLTPDNSDLTVVVTGNATLPAGVYSDTITVSIQAN